MTAKTVSIVSYITIIGWVIAYFQYKDSEPKNELASYHLEQGLGVFIFSVALNVALRIVISIVPSFASKLSLVGFVPLLLLIFGMIAANNEALKPLPLFGKFFEGKFTF